MITRPRWSRFTNTRNTKPGGKGASIVSRSLRAAGTLEKQWESDKSSRFSPSNIALGDAKVSSQCNVGFQAPTTNLAQPTQRLWPVAGLVHPTIERARHLSIDRGYWRRVVWRSDDRRSIEPYAARCASAERPELRPHWLHRLSLTAFSIRATEGTRTLNPRSTNSFASAPLRAPSE